MINILSNDLLYKIEVDITSKVKAGCDMTPEEYIEQFKIIFPDLIKNDLKLWECHIKDAFEIAKSHYNNI